MKPSILVPVDFTDNAFNAYLYANNMAYYLDCDLHLVHVFSGAGGAEKVDQLVSRLRSFSRWHPNEIEDKFYPVETTVEVLQGNVIDEILKKVNENLFRFLICGTRDQHTLMDKWLGTVSSEIATRAKVPVILVPQSAVFTNLDTIIVGCDENVNDDYVLSQIAVLTDWFESNVYFVHVHQSANEKFEVIERDILESLVALQKKPLKVQMAAIKGVDVVNALFNFASEKKADLLIVISQKRNFIKQLLFQSMTEKVALETGVPSMFIHL